MKAKKETWFGKFIDDRKSWYLHFFKNRENMKKIKGDKIKIDIQRGNITKRLSGKRKSTKEMEKKMKININFTIEYEKPKNKKDYSKLIKKIKKHYEENATIPSIKNLNWKQISEIGIALKIQ